MTGAQSSDRPAAPRSDWRRVARWLSLACLSAATVGALLVVWAFSDAARVSALLEALISQSTGRSLEINGDFEFQAGRWVTFRATDVTWASSPDSSEPHMATAAELSARLDLVSLARGQLVIDAASITGGLIVLEWLPDGRLNWALDEGDSAPSAEPPEALPIYLRAAELINSELRVLHPLLQAPLALNIDTARHTADAVDRLNLEVRASVNDRPVTLDGFIGPLPELVVAGAVNFDLRLGTDISTLSAAGDFDWLARLANPDLQLSFASADIAQTLRSFQLPAATTGTADFRASVITEQEGIEVRAGGEFGEFRLKSDFTVNNLRSLDGLSLTVASSGPSLRRLGRLAGLTDLPDTAYQLEARAYSSSAGLQIENLRFDAGPVQVSAAGAVGGFPAFSDIRFKLDATSPTAANVAALLNLPVAPEGDFALSTTIASAGPEQPDSIEAELRVGATTATIDGALSTAADFAGTTLNWHVSSPDVGPLLRGTNLAVAPQLGLQARGVVVKEAARLTLRNGTARLGDTSFSFAGSAPLQRDGAPADLTVSAAGDSLQSLLANLLLSGGAAAPFSIDARLLSDSGGLRITNLDFAAPRARITGALSLEPASQQVTFDLVGRGTNLADILPDLAGYRAPDAPFDIAARGSVRSGALFDVEKIAGSIGKAKLSIAGTLALEPEVTASDITISIQGPDISELGTFANQQLAPIDFALSASTAGNAAAVVVNDLVLQLGENTVSGKLRLIPGMTPRVNLELVSPRFNLDEILLTPTATEQPSTARLFSDAALPFDTLSDLNGFARIKANNVVIRERRLNALEAVIKLENGELIAERATAATELGEFRGSARIAPGETGHKVTLELTGSDISLMETTAPETALATLPRYVLDMRLTATGDTPRSLAATADGYVWVVGGGGSVPKQDFGLLFGDFFSQLLSTLNPFAKKNTVTEVLCQGAYFEVENGRMETAPNLVYQTSKVVIFAAGQVDLRTEKINFSFETTPREGIGVSLDDVFTPFTKVGGTLSKPKLTVDKQGTIIQGGAAAATGGLSLLAKSLWGRWVGSRQLCEKTAARALEQRRARDPENVPDLNGMLKAAEPTAAVGEMN